MDEGTDNRLTSSYDRHQQYAKQTPQQQLFQDPQQQQDDYDMNIIKKRNKSMNYLQKNQKYLFKRDLLSATKQTSNNNGIKLLRKNLS